MCALPGQGRYGYGAAVEYRRCEALHRRWVSATDWCASNPDRGRKLITDAPQCVAPATTYVTHDETEGWYDECLRPQRVAQLQRLADRHGTSLATGGRGAVEDAVRVPPGAHLQAGALPARRRPGRDRERHPARGRLPDVARHGRAGRARSGPDHRRAAGPTAEAARPSAPRLPAGPRRPGRAHPGARHEPGPPVQRPRPRRGHRQPAVLDRRHVRPALPGRPLAILRGSSTPPPSTPSGCAASPRPGRAPASRTGGPWWHEHPELLGDGVHLAPALELFWAKWIERSWDACLGQAQRADS